MRISGVVEESIVDGPGIRFTVFFQGCTHNCYKCHNPHTHDITKGKEISVDNLLKQIEKVPEIDGVTLSGGDPLLQIEECLKLCEELKKRQLEIILYTGYTFEEINDLGKKDSRYLNILNYIDYMVDGRFVYKLLDLSLRYRGSSNQRIIDIKETLKNNKVTEVEL